MKGRIPPSKRPGRAGGDGPQFLTDKELADFVKGSESHLRETWARRDGDTDVLVLGDVRDDEDRKECVSLWGEARVRAVLGAAEIARDRATMAYLMPIEYMTAMARHIERRGRSAEGVREIAASGLSEGEWIPVVVMVPGFGVAITTWPRPESAEPLAV